MYRIVYSSGARTGILGQMPQLPFLMSVEYNFQQYLLAIPQSQRMTLPIDNMGLLECMLFANQ